MVSICRVCGRGHSGYLHGTKTLPELSLAEVLHEIDRYEIKVKRLSDYIAGLHAGTRTPNGLPRQTPYLCGFGTREFKSRTCDLEQLTLNEAVRALRSARKDLARLRGQLPLLRRRPATAATP